MPSALRQPAFTTVAVRSIRRMEIIIGVHGRHARRVAVAAWPCESVPPYADRRARRGYRTAGPGRYVDRIIYRMAATDGDAGPPGRGPWRVARGPAHARSPHETRPGSSQIGTAHNFRLLHVGTQMMH